MLADAVVFLLPLLSHWQVTVWLLALACSRLLDMLQSLRAW